MPKQKSSFVRFSQRSPLRPDLLPLRDGSRPFGPRFRLGDGARPFGPQFLAPPAALDASSVHVRPPHYAGFGLGYLPDLPDRRDRRFSKITQSAETKPKNTAKLKLSEEALKFIDEKAFAAAIKLSENPAEKGPAAVLKPTDLRDSDCLPPIENQGSIGSCTAQAVVGLAEYLIRVGTGEFTDLARMFVYKVSRNLMGVSGDTGSYIRTAIKTLAAFGAPPETFWPYEEELLDVEPLALQYSYAANFRAMRYARLDDYNQTGAQTLELVKTVLAAGFPVAFGFPVFESIDDVGTGEDAVIPYPEETEKLLGGHAVLAVGFRGGGDKTELIVRNSWSEQWGDEGYGYLPAQYVTEGMAVDFWTVFSSSWLQEGKFE